MPPDHVEVDWVSLPGSGTCMGCARALIPTGSRALRVRRGPRGTERLSGAIFHGYSCLANRAADCADEEERNGSGRDEAFREMEYWARNQERAHRAAGQV